MIMAWSLKRQNLILNKRISSLLSAVLIHIPKPEIKQLFKASMAHAKKPLRSDLPHSSFVFDTDDILLESISELQVLPTLKVL